LLVDPGTLVVGGSSCAVVAPLCALSHWQLESWQPQVMSLVVPPICNGSDTSAGGAWERTPPHSLPSPSGCSARPICPTHQPLLRAELSWCVALLAELEKQTNQGALGGNALEVSSL
jgi:hypothetical protein